ncbi:MAG: alpha/beta fold hydrolase [Cyclobacteriaceae bacterium]
MLKSTYSILFVLCAILSACTPTTQTTKAELKRHTVTADGHPIAVWEKSATEASEAILLVHGRTWSAVPDFDLQVEGENLSLMDGLVERGYAVYAVDLRGYGETPRDSSEWFTPDRAAKDLASVLSWIDNRNEWTIKPHLFGWSMGSTNSQLTAQRYPELISSLTLFGYWFDNDQTIPADAPDHALLKIVNTAEAAASDFIVPGSISQRAIDAYVKMALKADPIKVDWKNLDQYNELDPSKVTVPTLILQGEHDPIGPTDKQVKLYTRLGTAHKQWVTVPGGDHAAFMETPRTYFIDELAAFLAGVSK